MIDNDWITAILLRDLGTLKAELAAFPDDESVWRTVPGVVNSAGTLALHCAGNIRHFIGAVLGATGYVRDREREFAARGLPRELLYHELDDAMATVRSTLAPGRSFPAEFPESVSGRYRVATGEFLIQLAVHLGFHVGQAGYLRRVVTGQDQSTGPMALGSLSTVRTIAPSAP